MPTARWDLKRKVESRVGLGLVYGVDDGFKGRKHGHTLHSYVSPHRARSFRDHQKEQVGSDQLWECKI